MKLKTLKQIFKELRPSLLEKKVDAVIIVVQFTGQENTDVLRFNVSQEMAKKAFERLAEGVPIDPDRTVQ